MPIENPAISIGMPVYNGGRWLGGAVESILTQRFDNFELVISDNASNDDTEEICRSYAAEDERVRYLRQQTNVGANGNYNAVFRESRAPYFKWASCNDICHKDFLLKCIDPLERRPDVALCYPRTRLFTSDPADGEDYEDGLDLQQDSACQRFIALRRKMRLNNVMNGIIRSSLLGRTPLMRPHHSSDVVLMAEIALRGKFVEVPDVLFYRRMDEASATYLKNEEEVIEHYAPGKRSMAPFQAWRIQIGYLSAALRAPLNSKERLCVLRTVARGTRWARWELLGDVYEAVTRRAPTSRN